MKKFVIFFLIISIITGICAMVSAQEDFPSSVYRQAAGGSSVPAIDTSRMRNLNTWKPAIQKYSLRHYGENTWQLKPSCIVLHYTAIKEFPWNLVDSTSFDGETPGLGVHYVVDGTKIWQILPDNVRSRGAYGINHRAINIEMMALCASDLSNRKKTMDTCAKLVKYLMSKHSIPVNKIYSHQNVASMNKRIVPEVYDKINSEPYGKTDPGEKNMQYIKSKLTVYGER